MALGFRRSRLNCYVEYCVCLCLGQEKQLKSFHGSGASVRLVLLGRVATFSKMAAPATVDDVSNASAPVDEENGGAAAAQTDSASNADAQSEILQEAMDVQEKAMKEMQADVKRLTDLVLLLTMKRNESKDETKADDNEIKFNIQKMQRR